MGRRGPRARRSWPCRLGSNDLETRREGHRSYESRQGRQSCRYHCPRHQRRRNHSGQHAQSVGGRMRRIFALLVLTFVAPGALSNLQAQNPPDFSGVYYPYTPPRGGAPAANTAAGQRGQRQGPPPPPTRSAPTGDLSNGRAATAPSLTPEYMAKWEVIRKSRMSGSYDYDPIANCLPPGMPQMMSMAYGMEIMQSKDKITFFSEWQDALRRVYLDGRKPSKKVLNDPTYAGYSTGHWEGDTLVVDTVALNDKSFIDNSSPHS